MKTPICHPEAKYYSKGFCRSCYEKNLIQNNIEYKKRQLENSLKWAQSHKKEKSEMDQIYRRSLSFETKRKNYLRKKYKLTLEEFREILKFQNNKCNICEQILNEGDRYLHIDHCHDTNKIRGILCSQCNWFMSKIDTVSNCLNNLNEYVKNQESKWEKQDVITKEN